MTMMEWWWQEGEEVAHDGGSASSMAHFTAREVLILPRQIVQLDHEADDSYAPSLPDQFPRRPDLF